MKPYFSTMILSYRLFPFLLLCLHWNPTINWYKYDRYVHNPHGNILQNQNIISQAISSCILVCSSSFPSIHLSFHSFSHCYKVFFTPHLKIYTKLINIRKRKSLKAFWLKDPTILKVLEIAPGLMIKK